MDKILTTGDRNIFLENKELNTQEMRSNKIVLNSKPLRLGIILTDWCNIHCIMCPSSRNNGSSVFSKAILSKIEQLLPYLEIIDWQGGEFFNFKYLKKIFSQLKVYPHITHVITTNGLLLDEEWIELLIELDANLIFSIDSPKKETYEYIRKGADYDKLIGKLELIKKCEARLNKKLKREITAVVMRSNYRHLVDFIPFTEEYGFSSINFNPIMFLENEENIFEDINGQEMRYLNEIESYIKRTLAKSGIGCGWNLPMDSNFERGTLYCSLPLDMLINLVRKSLRKAVGKYMNNPLEGRYNEETNISFSKKKVLYCHFPWQMMWVSIEREGGIFPNCWCIHPIGNIFRDNLLEVWNSDKMQEYRRNIIMKNNSLCNKDCISGYTAIINPKY